MMPFVVGEDPETKEIIVGDTRRNVFFLRGPRSELNAIRDFVQAANERIHIEPVEHDGGGLPRVD